MYRPVIQPNGLIDLTYDETQRGFQLPQLPYDIQAQLGFLWIWPDVSKFRLASYFERFIHHSYFYHRSRPSVWGFKSFMFKVEVGKGNKILRQFLSYLSKDDLSEPEDFLSDTHITQNALPRIRFHNSQGKALKLDFYQTLSGPFMPNRQRFRSHSRDSRSSRPYPSQRPYQAVTPVTPPPASTEKPKSSTKVVDMSGGFDCRICLDSFENIRKDAKSVRPRVRNSG